MDYAKVIADLEAKCAACLIGKAKQALVEVQKEFSDPAPMDARAPTESASTRSKPTQSGSLRGYVNRSECSTDGKLKLCHKCGLMMQLEQFPKHKDCLDGHAGTCRNCARASAKKWYRAVQAHKKASLLASPEPAAPPPKQSPVPAGQKKFECATPGCGKKFATKYVFEEHQRMRHRGA